MQNTGNLLVADRALRLAVETYRLTSSFPSDERFGLTSQMRRAAVSIGSNIAEGCGRGTDKELAAFLQVAMGSSSELKFQLRIASALEYSSPASLRTNEELVNEVMRMLSRLIVAVRARTRPASRGL
ncbi:MAG: four helix bundle protein [Gemmatimonadota bacterium]|nr:four helix bundle protein [Gemmatimonadota bacterium]